MGAIKRDTESLKCLFANVKHLINNFVIIKTKLLNVLVIFICLKNQLGYIYWIYGRVWDG